MQNFSYQQSEKIKKIIINFDVIKGEIKKVSVLDNGRINKTYKINIKNKSTEKSYLLQEINSNVFTKPNELMDNIVGITKYISNKGQTTIKFINVKGNQASYLYITKTEEETHYWRCYEFLEADVYQCINSTKDMKKLGNAVAKFADVLDGYPAEELFETIPDFHNTHKRFENFLLSVYRCAKYDYERMKVVKDLIDDIISRKDLFSIITDGLKTGRIPTRVTHNDPKLNNVLFDKNTGEAKCLIDLDTVMPGSILYDIGDAIRYGANTASEEELDLKKVHFNVELALEFIKGYIEVMGDKLNGAEIEYMTLAPQIMAWELAIRFLTDYLDGNKYFNVSYDTQNVDRAKVQIALAHSMEMNSYKIKEFIDSTMVDKV